MRLYVCRPTNADSVAACERYRFGALLAPVSVRRDKQGRPQLDDLSGYTAPPPGLDYVIDNGAWPASEAGLPWQPEPFERLLRRLGLDDRGRYRGDLGRGFAVLPDIVGAGEESLAFSLAWWREHRGGLAGDAVAHWLLAVQDGMTVARVREALVEHRLSGIFVGGSTDWKWATLHDWTELGLGLGLRVHVGRVNGEGKARLCARLGANSIDGRSVTMYSVNAPKMARPCDGDDRPLPPPGRARQHLPAELRRRVEQLEPMARRAIAARRAKLLAEARTEQLGLGLE